MISLFHLLFPHFSFSVSFFSLSLTVLYVSPNIYILKDGTALHRAAINGHLEVARLLIDRWADININDREVTMLWYLSSMFSFLSSLSLFLFLLSILNCSLYFPEYIHILKGVTALYDSAVWGRLEVARLLIDRSADINMKEKTVTILWYPSTIFSFLYSLSLSLYLFHFFSFFSFSLSSLRLFSYLLLSCFFCFRERRLWIGLENKT